MCGLKVVPVKCLENGSIDLEDMQLKAEKHRENLCALMLTYPSTYGLFEPGVRRVIDIVHKYGGLVYLDGANMNAQVGLTSPGDLGADVCHLNIHKTFALSHGGGGPGQGPVCVAQHLVPFLPKHPFVETPHASDKSIRAVNAAPFGSAAVIPVSYSYIKMLGSELPPAARVFMSASIARVLAGPTCDSIDVIAENLMLPELKAGDLIVGRAMGAYTWASASDFNFFPKATVVAVNETPGDTGSVSNFPL